VTAVLARDLAIGDIWHLNDWYLHITHVHVEGGNVAILVREYFFLIHEASDNVCDVEQVAS
jgi:hypothetical protein